MTSPEIISFEQKECHAKETIKKVYSHAKNPCIFFSGGKKSVVLLHLIKSVINGPITVIFIDNVGQYDSVKQYIIKMKKLWKFSLFIEDAHLEKLKKNHDPVHCYAIIMMAPLKKAIQTNKNDCVILGSTAEDRDHYCFSDLSNTDITISCSYPLINFTSKDIWEYIKKNNLPYCRLYDEGLIKIDCEPCNIKQKNESHGDNKLQDEKIIREKLKKLGYL